MPTALARPPVRPPLQGASCWRPAHHRDRRQHQIYIALAARPLLTSRDFVPWRFLDAGQLTARVFHCCRRPKTSTKCEELNVSKSSPLYAFVRTSTGQADTSQKVQGTKSL